VTTRRPQVQTKMIRIKTVQTRNRRNELTTRRLENMLTVSSAYNE
jgi:hypothetical protein